MVKLAVCPNNRIVAALASRRESQRDMIHRSLRAVVSGLVTRHASRAGQVVVVVDVAQRALRSRMGSSQRPARAGVIKLAVRPNNCVMAPFAGQRESQRYVVNRRLGAVVSRLVTRDARRSGQVVIVVDMALCARGRRVRSSQGKAGRRVIKRRIHPVRGVVAPLASRGVAEGDMVDWRLGVVVIRLVARHTGCVGQLVVVINVALCARCGRMQASKRPTRAGVVELAVGPQDRVVTTLTCRRKTQSDVVNRRFRVVVIRLVARDAGRASQLVVVVDMAQRAL